MAKIVIAGAGLTGLSTAYHLEKNKFDNFEIYEKENEIGGLCRSVKQDGFTFDYTGHLLHINDIYFEEFIKNTISVKKMNNIIRRSFIFSNNVYTRYPFQINLKGLPTDIIAECIEEYVNRKITKNPKSFFDWANSNFGKGFSKYFFVPFQNKIFDYDIKNISSSWTGRFVPKTSLREMIIGAIEDSNESVGYNSSFYYPKENGIQSWINNIEIKKEIKLDHDIEKINIKNKEILFKNGVTTKYDYLITTMPLDILLNKINSKNFDNATKNLKCNSVINFNLGINRKELSDKHWIYFPESQFPFYRIGFPHNFSEKMAPENCSSLYGEFAFIEKDQKYIKEKLDNSIKQVKKLLKIENKEILTEKVISIKHAYVIYNFWREKNLKKLLTSLKEYDIYSVGRYGAWKYSSMQEAVLDGKNVVDSILIRPAKTIYEFETEFTKTKQLQK